MFDFHGFLSLSTLAIYVATTTLPCVALAQDSNSPAAPGFPNDSRVFEEIIVTAQKREQSLNDVGITVNAFSGF